MNGFALAIDRITHNGVLLATWLKHEESSEHCLPHRTFEGLTLF